MTQAKMEVDASAAQAHLEAFEQELCQADSSLLWHLRKIFSGIAEDDSIAEGTARETIGMIDYALAGKEEHLN
jgi:hypothetical protein